MKKRMGRQSGLTLIETLIVVVIASITLMIVSPLVAGRVKVAKARVAANQLEIDLRAARLTAVSNRKAVDVIVRAEPANNYEYSDARGDRHLVQMPSGVRIVGSTSPISFRPNGTVLGGAKTVIQTERLVHGAEQWVVETSTIGVTRASRTSL